MTIDHRTRAYDGITAALKNLPRIETEHADWLNGYDKTPELVEKGIVGLEDGELRFCVSPTPDIENPITEFLFILGFIKRPAPKVAKVMPVVRPVKPDVRLPAAYSEYGVYGDHTAYFRVLDWDAIRKNNPMPVGSLSQNPWKALKRLGIDIQDLKDMATNTCPCSEMTYTAFVPVAVLTDDAMGKYFNNMDRLPPWHEATADGSWNRRNWFELNYQHAEDKPEQFFGEPKTTAMDHIGNVKRAILGSGYTDCILPSDGSNDLELVGIALDNGDTLICAAWVWFNK